MAEAVDYAQQVSVVGALLSSYKGEYKRLRKVVAEKRKRVKREDKPQLSGVAYVGWLRGEKTEALHTVATSRSMCIHMSEDRLCGSTCVPFSQYCFPHILNDAEQQLFEECQHSGCPNPVLKRSSGLCDGHRASSGPPTETRPSAVNNEANLRSCEELSSLVRHIQNVRKSKPNVPAPLPVAPPQPQAMAFALGSMMAGIVPTVVQDAPSTPSPVPTTVMILPPGVPPA